MWTSKELSKVLNHKINKDFVVDSVSIDSRTIKKKSLFIPIKGEKFNGHKFISNALKNGAKCSIIEKKYLNTINNIDKKILIPVRNSSDALLKLAKFSRNRSKKTRMICVTGSSGKTTIKEWLKRIIGIKKNIFVNPGNFNNEIGMPLSLCNMPKKTEISVMELGMNQPGEIEKLTNIANPNISIITNIGPAHIGNFSDQSAIAYEKASIFRNKFQNIGIIPRDSDCFKILKKESEENSKNTFSFGYNKYSDFQILKYIPYKNNRTKICFRLLNQKIEIYTKNHGKHWAINTLIVFSVLKLLEINFDELLEEISLLSPENGRGSIHNIYFKGKNITLLDDSYNSNPLSLNASLETMKQLINKRKICIIGDMLELGEKSESFHRKVINSIISAKADIVYTIGEHSEIISKSLPKNIDTSHFKNLKILYDKLSSNINEGDLIMVKGSNSIGLNTISKNIKESF